jgi:HEAT repeat protein
VDIAGLVERLKHKDPDIRRGAAEVLARIGPPAEGALPALLQAAADVDAGVRARAAEALPALNPAWWTSRHAAEAVPALVRELGSKFPDVWRAASYLLAQIGPPALRRLVNALANGGKEIRQAVLARTIGRIGPAAGCALPTLLKELGSESAPVRQAVAEALGQIGPTAAPAVPALALALGDWHPGVRQAAARALAALGPAAEPAVPALIQRLPDEAEEVRQASLEALGRIGPPAVPALAEILQQRDTRRMADRLQERMAIKDWLERIDLEAYQREPLKALRNVQWHFSHALDDRVETVHHAAATALGKIGPPAGIAVPVLLESLGDRDSRVRQAVAAALGQIGPEARAALPALAGKLADPSEAVRKTGADALGKIDPDWAGRPELEDTLTTLAGMLGRSGAERQLAAGALVQMGRASVPSLTRSLQDADRQVREAAATALGLIGPAAGQAIPVLRLALQDDFSWVREAAAQALQRIAPAG